jgi:hypothetical protein
MPNRNLSQSELRDLFAPLFADVRGKLEAASAGDMQLLWALRRKLAKELSYLERGKPGNRKALKFAKRVEQRGLCAICGQPLPDQGAVLDRKEAMAGYMLANTRLVHHDCDRKLQAERGFA